MAEERISFSMEADFELSDAVVEAVNREIRDMRRPSRGMTMRATPSSATGTRPAIRPNVPPSGMAAGTRTGRKAERIRISSGWSSSRNGR